jgi:hypothetical protein
VIPEHSPRPLGRPSASRSCCTTSSACPSRRSRPSSNAPLMRPANWPAAHAAMSRNGKPFLMSPWKFNEVSSPPLLRLHMTVTSSGSSRCATRTWSSEAMPARRQVDRSRSLARSRCIPPFNTRRRWATTLKPIVYVDSKKSFSPVGNGRRALIVEGSLIPPSLPEQYFPDGSSEMYLTGSQKSVRLAGFLRKEKFSSD